MLRMLSLPGLLVALIVVLVVTGSGGRGGIAGASEEFLSARGDLDRDLDAVALALSELDSVTGASRGGSADSTDQRSRLRRSAERRKAIVAKLDSLERSGGDSWNGAMVGLRANVAELEYRVDLLYVEAAVSASAFDSLFTAWLSSARRDLAVTGHGVVDSVVVPFGDERVALRARTHQLDERWRAVSGDTGAGVAERRELGEALSEVRRRLRALIRSAHRPDRSGRD